MQGSKFYHAMLDIKLDLAEGRGHHVEGRETVIVWQFVNAVQYTVQSAIPLKPTAARKLHAPMHQRISACSQLAAQLVHRVLNSSLGWCPRAVRPKGVHGTLDDSTGSLTQVLAQGNGHAREFQGQTSHRVVGEGQEAIEGRVDRQQGQHHNGRISMVLKHRVSCPLRIMRQDDQPHSNARSHGGILPSPIFEPRDLHISPLRSYVTNHMSENLQCIWKHYRRHRSQAHIFWVSPSQWRADSHCTWHWSRVELLAAEICWICTSLKHRLLANWRSRRIQRLKRTESDSDNPWQAVAINKVK